MLVSMVSGALPEGVQEVAPGAYFHQGDRSLGHSNNGWVVFEDFVMVIDANYPSGARVVQPKVAATSNHPVKVVFDTHHHHDHTYGNRVWADAGALLVAQEGAARRLKEIEPDNWHARASQRPGMRGTSFKHPQVLSGDALYFEDDAARVELLWFGEAHTQGDGFAWLPESKVLFTGDAVVNGPYNYVGDGSIQDWIETLEHVKALGAQVVCPGHGPVGGPELVVGQQAFFVALMAEAKALRDQHATPAEAEAAADHVFERMKANEEIANWVAADRLPGQLEKAWTELGGAAWGR